MSDPDESQTLRKLSKAVKSPICFIYMPKLLFDLISQNRALLVFPKMEGVAWQYLQSPTVLQGG